MKILSISNMDIWPEGENKGIPSIFYSQKRFVERGNEVYFLCPANTASGFCDYERIKIFRFKVPFSFRLILRLRLDNALEHLLSTFLSNLEWLFFQFLSFFWLLRFSLTFKPDIIYVHGLNSAFNGWLVCRITGRKLVFRVYGTRDLFWLFKNPFYRIKEFRDYSALKLKPDLFFITKDGTRGASLAKLLGADEKRIINFRNGVDFSMYSLDLNLRSVTFRQLGIESNKKIILSLARLTPFYGVDKLIHCLPQLFQVDSSAVCVICGDGPERRSLEDFAKKNGIDSRVVFLGVVDRKMIKQLLNSSDIFVSLSAYSNTNNSLMEAMVCARCILSLRDDTVEETLTHNENAIIIKPQELTDLATILHSILIDEEKRKRIGEQALIRAKEIFEPWPQRIDREIQLLEGLLKR